MYVGELILDRIGSRCSQIRQGSTVVPKMPLLLVFRVHMATHTHPHTDTNSQKNKKSKHSGALRTEGRRHWTGKSKATWKDYTKSQDAPSEFLFFENN